MTRIALISLEPWDEVWRRNQHLCLNLVQQGLASEILFVEPAIPGRHRRQQPADVPPGVRIVHPRLRLPKRLGGLRLVGGNLRKTLLRDVELVWVNDAALGRYCLPDGCPAIYDVTDDWRTFDFPRRIVRRIIKAEDALARRAKTVVCSAALRDRWQARYGVDAAIVQNGIDTEAWHNVKPKVLAGKGPHVGYIGTLHSERLDVDLLWDVAGIEAIGTLHLVGPDSLSEPTRQRLQTHPKIVLHGPVPAGDVPAITAGMDLLISPHRMTPFTASLDAIKSREYLASGVPIVATPTSGFELLDQEDGVQVASPAAFIATVTAMLQSSGKTYQRDVTDMSWARRAAEFAQQWPRPNISPTSPTATSLRSAAEQA